MSILYMSILYMSILSTLGISISNAFNAIYVEAIDILLVNIHTCNGMHVD